MTDRAGQDTLESSAPTLNPTRLSIEDAVRLLRAAGSRSVTVESLRADLDRGAPANADGTINVVHYAAWLVSQAAGCRPRASGFREEDGALSLPEARSLKSEASSEAYCPEGSHD
jgi:hypothetical protein